MNDLFIALYLDEDVDVLVAALIRARGFVATTTVDEGRRGRADADQLAFAVDRGFVFLTHNRADFEALATVYVETGRHHAGSILAVRRPPNELAGRLLRLLNDVTSDEMRDRVLYL